MGDKTNDDDLYSRIGPDFGSQLRAIEGVDLTDYVAEALRLVDFSPRGASALLGVALENLLWKHCLRWGVKFKDVSRRTGSNMQRDLRAKITGECENAFDGANTLITLVLGVRNRGVHGGRAREQAAAPTTLDLLNALEKLPEIDRMLSAAPLPTTSATGTPQLSDLGPALGAVAVVGPWTLFGQESDCLVVEGAHGWVQSRRVADGVILDSVEVGGSVERLVAADEGGVVVAAIGDELIVIDVHPDGGLARWSSQLSAGSGQVVAASFVAGGPSTGPDAVVVAILEEGGYSIESLLLRRRAPVSVGRRLAGPDRVLDADLHEGERRLRANHEDLRADHGQQFSGASSCDLATGSGVCLSAALEPRDGYLRLQLVRTSALGAEPKRKSLADVDTTVSVGRPVGAFAPELVALERDSIISVYSAEGLLARSDAESEVPPECAEA